MTDWIYRVDMTVYTSGTTKVLRYATRDYVTTGANSMAPNAVIEGRVTQPLLFSRFLYSENRTHGDIEIDHGEVVLQNADGGLDFLHLGYGLDQRLIELYRVDPASLDTQQLVWRGSMESVELDMDVMTVTVRELTYVFDRAFQPTKYAGTNSAPNGLEGTPNDIKGQPKPRALGSPLNFEPILVNAVRYIYQLHDRALNTGFSITVYDKRNPLSAGISRALTDFNNGATAATVSSIDTTLDQITLVASVGFLTGDPVHVASTASLPGGVLDTQYYYVRVISSTVISLHDTAAHASANTNKIDITSAGSGTITVAENRTPYGCYDWCSDASGSYIRLGLQPTRVTCNLVNGTAATYCTLASVLSQLLDFAEADYADIAALAFVMVTRTGQQNAQVGFFWNQETTYYQAFRDVLASVGASIHSYVDRNSFFNALLVQRLGGTSDLLTIDGMPYDMVKNSLKRIVPGDDERGIPVWRVNVNYKRNYTVMNATELVGIAASDIAFTQLEWRTTKADVPPTLDYYPGAPELNVDTGLALETDAQDFASNFLLYYLGNPDGQMFEVQAPLEVVTEFVQSTMFLNGVTPGETYLNIDNIDRFDIAGRDFGLVGVTLDYQQQTAELVMWALP